MRASIIVIAKASRADFIRAAIAAGVPEDETECLKDCAMEFRVAYEIHGGGAKPVLSRINGRKLDGGLESKPIRQPNRYESLLSQIDEMPLTWIPAIIKALLLKGVRGGIFDRRGILDFVSSRLSEIPEK